MTRKTGQKHTAAPSPPAPKSKGGRPKGSRSRATIEKEIKLAAAVIDGATKPNAAPLLGKDVLERMMRLAEGATALHRPTPKRDVLLGAKENPDGSWEKFGAWFDRTVTCAKELAKYQSPTFKAVLVSQAPGNVDQAPVMIESRATGTDGAERLQQASQTYLKLLRGGKG